MYECRCDERLKTKTMEVTSLSHTGLAVELEHLNIETRLTIEKFASSMGEYVTEVIGDPSRLRLIRKAAVLERIFPHFVPVCLFIMNR
jgi:hypothetical protein